MCAPTSVVPAGNPASCTVKSAVADVMAPAASRVMLKAISTCPLPPASAFVTAGTSFDGSNAIENFTRFGFDVADVGDFEPQPIARIVRPTTSSDRCLIALLL